MYKIKRVYLAPEKEDHFRVLVDRLWPRELSKEKANVDVWLKDIAPSNDLRTWFGHDLERYDNFKKKYLDELKKKKELIKQLRTIEKIHQTVTLVYSSRDEEHNNAVVLMEFLKKPSKKVSMGISRIHG